MGAGLGVGKRRAARGGVAAITTRRKQLVGACRGVDGESETPLASIAGSPHVRRI